MPLPLPALVPGLRRPRDEDDINDLESPPPRKRKLVPMVDLTEGAGLVRRTKCLNIIPEDESSHHTPDTRFGPLIPSAQPRIQSSSQKCFQPFSLGPIHKGQVTRPGSTLRTSKAAPSSRDVPSGTYLNTGLRTPTAGSPISAPRLRVTSPIQRVVGRDKSPHSLFNIPGILPRSKTTNQSARATVSSCLPAEKYYELELDSILHNGHLLRVRKTVELSDGTFLRIASIKNRISDNGDDFIFLQGSKFQRARNFMGMLPLRKNEVAMCSLSENVPLSEVLKPRILILTNAAFPKYRVIAGDKEIDEIEGRLVCRWRIKVVSKQEGYMWRLQQHEVDAGYQVDDGEQRKRWRGGLVELVKMLQEGALQDTPCENLFEQEGFVEWSARKKNFVDLTAEKQREEGMKEMHHTAIVTNSSSLELKQTYDLLKASGLKSSRYEATIDSRTPAVKSKWLLVPQDITLSKSPSKSFPEKYNSLQNFKNSPKSPPPRPVFKPGFSPPTKYKFGDAFCGGGGMSSGARSAGFANAWSFDFNIDAVATYRMNFPGCKTYHISANEFVALPPEDLLVDVVHLSPPCQPHSPAHTIAGKDDDRNEASLFCIKECLEASRPRIVTLEQTDGILNRQEWFRSLVLCFTELGFSVSWKVLHGVEYGLPQTRKRLFLLAASPGELLPDFPTPKYAHPTRDKHLNSSLPPARTVRSAIGYIPYSSTCHQPLYFPNGFRPSPVDFDQPLRATILASGGPYDVHPSGLRPFTPRELACLQTFPVTHDFAGSVFQKKKQIGNAVPPVLAKALLKEVRKTLEKADRERSKKAEEDAGKGKGKGRGKGRRRGKGKGKRGEKEKENEGWVTILQSLGGKEKEEEDKKKEREKEEKGENEMENEMELQATINITDDEEGRVTVLQSLRGKENEKDKEGLQTAINIPDDEEGNVTILQPPEEMELQETINIPEEMELQATINIPNDEESGVTILQSFRGKEKGEELQTAINIPDDEEGNVTILQPPEEMELQTTINIPDDGGGKVTILQSLGGIMVMTVD
ncbi:hypothetical protein Q9L58_004986 [Maublancomyces gigas]|uniref:DNA (cytosine-5-)-methyltransferase n=1 Tax=Discina gigas TaxID=1032678 RepID=A0ABR3GJI5_9PEZI